MAFRPIRAGSRSSRDWWRASGQQGGALALAIGADADRELLARFSSGGVHEASEAAQIRNFLQFVTTTITQATLSSFEPDVPVEAVSEDSIVRLQSDDAF